MSKDEAEKMMKRMGESIRNAQFHYVPESTTERKYSFLISAERKVVDRKPL